MEIASVTSSLTPLAFLACPVGMGAMMWFMMRGNKSQRQSGLETPPADDRVRPASLELLREEHERLGAEIGRLEHHGTESPETTGRR